MQNWFKEVREETTPILDAIKIHPFITELMDGTLSKEVFQFYIHQDAHYLSEYKKILALVAVKCTNAQQTQFFLDAATGILAVENALHQVFLKDQNRDFEPSPTCELYTSYLSRIVNQYSIAEGLAAVLPCFTIYKEIGDYILAQQTNKQDNPYQDWMDTYGGEAFALSVENAVEITNTYAQTASIETIESMNLIFKKASKLEWMFWDSAYTKEEWKV